MKKNLFAICVFILLPVLALGQEADDKWASRGYGFVAPGAAIGDGSSTELLHFGGGAEGNIYKGLGVGAEIGYLTPLEAISNGAGVFSVDGLYRFHKSRSKIEPFLVGGYSLLFRSDFANAVNFGGGIDYWFRKKLGMRFEFRDHFSPHYLDDHIIQGRIGVVFR